MKKVIHLILILCLSLSCLSACSGSGQPSGSSAPAPADSSAGASQEATPAPADNTVYELNVNFSHPESSASVQTKMLDKISELSGGRLKFNYYFSNSLISVSEIVKSLGTGVVDVSTVPMLMFPDQMVYSGQIISMPFLGIDNVADATHLFGNMLTEFPEVREEIEGLGMKVVAWYAMNGYHFHFKDHTDIRVPSDLGGAKIMCTETLISKLITAQGGAPIASSTADYYTNLEKGVAQGVVNNYTNMVNYGAAEQVSMSLDFGPGGTNYNIFLVAVSEKTWNSLPEDLQQIFLDVQEEWLAGEIDRNVQQESDSRAKMAEQNGYEAVSLTREELEAWQQAILPTHEEYLAELESRGFASARAIYDYIYRHFNG